MLLWILLLGGLALVAAALALVLAMGSAEKRARRSLFRTLGLPEETVDLLMARNGDVLAELALVRRQDMAGLTGAGLSGAEPAALEPSASRAQPAIRLVHPTGVAAPTPAEPARPSGSRRRLQLPGRQSRP